VTALASCGALLIAAEGPFLRFYHAKTSRYITSRRVFKAQAVHGICVYAEEFEKVTKLVVWGGRLARAVHIDAFADDQEPKALSLSLSNVVKAPDWILDLAPRMSCLDDGDVYERAICAAVTAHNALLELNVQCQTGTAPRLELSELTTSSRSILYSAHLLWDTPNCILVAAGTAFGEIMYWSWNKIPQDEATSSIHRVFLGVVMIVRFVYGTSQMSMSVEFKTELLRKHKGHAIRASVSRLLIYHLIISTVLRLDGAIPRGFGK
jgi:hypothetical protein